MFWILQLSQQEADRKQQFDRGAPGSRVAQRGVQVAQNVGRAGRAVGTGAQVAGKGAQVAGKGMQAAGQGVKAAGQGLQAGGRAMTAAGTALSGTGVGAIAGVPLAVAGGGVTAAGAGAQAVGTGIGAAGKGVEQAGNAVDKVGSRLAQGAKRLQKAGEDIIDQAQPGGEAAKKFLEQARRFPLARLMEKSFPVLFWIISYIAKSFSPLVVIVVLISLPLLWFFITLLAMFSNSIRFKLPLIPFQLPKTNAAELIVSLLVAITAVALPIVIILDVICGTPVGLLVRAGLAIKNLFTGGTNISCE